MSEDIPNTAHWESVDRMVNSPVSAEPSKRFRVKQFFKRLFKRFRRANKKIPSTIIFCDGCGNEHRVSTEAYNQGFTSLTCFNCQDYIEEEE